MSQTQTCVPFGILGRVIIPFVSALALSVPSTTVAQDEPPDDELPHQQAFAEGATGFFTTDVNIVNPHEDTPATVRVSFHPEQGEPVEQTFTLDPLTRTTISANEALEGVATGVSILVESDVQVAADRTMAWGEPAYGSSLETGAAEPSLTWHFAEGTTAGVFHTFFLLQNPSEMPATAAVTYLPESGPPVVQEVPLEPFSRRTLWVNGEQPALVDSFATTITADQPIVAERAVYLNAGGQVFGAGATALGATALGTEWYFAEGATGAWFDTFLLFGNDNETDATVTVSYLRPVGPPIEQTYTVPAKSRTTVWVDAEGDPLMADTVSAVVTSNQEIIAERAMWWPGPTAASWTEAHASVGATSSGIRWAVPSGAQSDERQTYVLVSNGADVATELMVTAIFDDGTTAERQIDLDAEARLTLNIGAVLPETEDQAFSLVIESLAGEDAPVSVEYSQYGSLDGVPFSSGGNAQAVLIEPEDDDEEPEPTSEED